MPTELKRCSRCVMPETWEGLTFNEEGVCNICREYDKQIVIDWKEREQQFSKLLRHYASYAKRKGIKWNCIVGISGGKDSIYTLWAMKHKYGMTPLAVTAEHGLPLGEEGEWNLREVPARMGIDHIFFRGDRILRNKIARCGMEIMADWCTFCHLSVGAFHAWVAKGFGVPLSIFGEPTSLYQTTGTGYSVEQLEEQNREHYETAFCGNKIKELTPKGYTERDMQPHTWPARYFPFKSVYLGDFDSPWNQREHVAIIKKECNWQEPPPPNYSWIGWDKADCILGESVREYTKWLKRGFGKASFQASKDIREGLISREQGLKLVEQYEGKKPQELTAFLVNELNMTEEEFLRMTLAHKVRR